MKTFEQSLADQVRTLTTWLMVLSIAFVFVLGIAVWGVLKAVGTGNDLTASQSRTCHIQARGLPAGHELAAVIIDLDGLVAFPPTTKAQQQAVALEPPAERKLVADLKLHLKQYKADEGAQPPSRSC